LFINRFRAFILFAENSQILLKISVIPILLTFLYVALNLLLNNQLNSSLRQKIETMNSVLSALCCQILHSQWLYPKFRELF
jgi:hypothetical protein